MSLTIYDCRELLVLIVMYSTACVAAHMSVVGGLHSHSCSHILPHLPSGQARCSQRSPRQPGRHAHAPSRAEHSPPCSHAHRPAHPTPNVPSGHASRHYRHQNNKLQKQRKIQKAFTRKVISSRQPYVCI